MKIKFLANYPPSVEVDRQRLRFSVNPSYFYLKHFYDLHGKNTNVDWQMADLFVLDDFDTIIARHFVIEHIHMERNTAIQYCQNNQRTLS